ncbi:MAG: TonB-dependent receptor [Acidobacteria bacterium]|nr:TonB-dependent receptor [Acidobacteriota bacterium]
MRAQRLILILFLVSAILGLCSGAPAWAQSEATSGTLRGTVSDASGGLVPGAKVTVKNLETGYTRETQTGDDGYFNIPLLPVGLYELRVEKQGFSTLVQSNLQVSIGVVTAVNLELKLGAATEVIEVKGAAPLVETTRTQVSAVVDDTAVRALPLHGRNYLDFVLLTPGVVRDNNRGGDISFGGLKGTYNSLQIDGVDNNNNFFGQSLGRTGVRAPFQFSQEAVAEFQVKTNSYGAEYGRAGGAVINVVTKTGANELHGSLFTYYRDNRLNANKWELNRASKPKPPLRVWQYGAVASGPLIRDKAFWLFNYDAQRRKEPNPIVCPFLAGTPNAAACTSAAADPFLGPLIQDYQRTLDQDVFLGKGDWRISSNHNLSVRYNYQRFTGGSLENSGDTSVRLHTGDSLVRTHSLSGNLVSTFGTHWINEFRAQWGRDSEPGTANGSDPEIQLFQAGTLFLQLGRNNFSPRETTIKRGQFVDNVSYLLGKHTVKFGADFNIERILNFFPGLFGGRYSFNCLADFQDNKRPDGSAGCSVGSYTQNFAGTGTSGPTTHPNITEYSWFVQDEFRAMPSLTLTFGVRYDLQITEKPSIVNPNPQLATLDVNTGQMNTDRNNFGPRVGFAWSPRFGRQVVVRGGYGIYYGRTPSIMTATATSNNGLQVIGITITGTSPLLPPGFAYPATLPAPPTGATPATPSLYVFDKTYVQPYVQQGSLGAEVQLAQDWSVGASYLVVKGTHLSRSNDINLGAPVATTFPVSTGGTLTVQRFPATSSGAPIRPASNFGRITAFQSNANSIYHALALSLNKRFSHHFQAAANYTFSKAIDDKPDSTSVVPGNAGDDVKMSQSHQGFPDDRGLSDQDFRHRFVLLGSWELDYLNRHDNFLVRHVLGHWSYSQVFAAQNGRHYSTQTGGDPNADGNRFTDRVPGIARNTNTLPAQISMDIRVGHDFPIYERLKAIFLFEAFNLFNRPNFRDANNIAFNLTGGAFVPQASFNPPNPNDRFVGTYDHPGGGSANPGPGPRTLQLAIKLTW